MVVTTKGQLLRCCRSAKLIQILQKKLLFISVPIHHHSNKHVSDQASNTTAAHAVNSGHADCLGTAGLQLSPDAPGWRP